MGDDEKKSKIVTDENWKDQARAEKEKLAEEEKKQAPATSAQGEPSEAGPMPPANFMTLLNSLVIQILFGLGRVGDPNTKEPLPVNLDLAKHHIDMLQVLEDKTKGNLSEEESQALSLALHEVRMQYVQTAQT